MKYPIAMHWNVIEFNISWIPLACVITRYIILHFTSNTIIFVSICKMVIRVYILAILNTETIYVVRKSLVYQHSMQLLRHCALLLWSGKTQRFRKDISQIVLIKSGQISPSFVMTWFDTVSFIKCQQTKDVRILYHCIPLERCDIGVMISFHSLLIGCSKAHTLQQQRNHHCFPSTPFVP